MFPDLDRRQFLGLAATGMVVAMRPSLLELQPWRVGILAPTPVLQDAAARGCLDGLLLGQEEATRTARLFGRAISFVSEDVGTDADTAQVANRLIDGGADVLITALDDSMVRRVAAVAIDRQRITVHLLAGFPAHADPASISWNFHLAPQPEARAAAVLEALHRSGTDLQARAPRTVLFGAPDDEALAVRLDRETGQAANTQPILARVAAPGANEPRNARTVVLAARDPDRAASLIETIGGSSFEGLLVDLFGSTERLPHDALPPDLMRADAWAPDLDRFGAAQLNDRFRARFGAEAAMRGPAWAGWFAAKAVAEAALRTRAGGGPAFADTFRSSRFDGHQGRPLSFAPDGTLAHPLHVIGTTDPAH